MRRCVTIAAFAFSALLSSGSYAQTSGTDCTVVGISLNYNFVSSSYANAKNELDTRLYKLNVFLMQNHITQLDTLSLAYKIDLDKPSNTMRLPAAGSPTGAPQYRLTGTAEYQLTSSEDAFKIGQFLTQSQFQVAVANKTNKNGCPKPVATAVATATLKPVISPAATAPANTTNSAISNVLNARPPANEVEPTAMPGATRSGAISELPVLDQDPPEVEPLKPN